MDLLQKKKIVFNPKINFNQKKKGEIIINNNSTNNKTM